MKNIFYPIPNAPEYAINSKGEVKNIKTGKFLKPYKHKDRPTPKFHIPKYHIRQTAKSLFRQALTAFLEKDKTTSWLTIPSVGGNYEINIHGKVRNSKTKQILKPRFCGKVKCVSLSVNCKQFNRSIHSLLWEVHGIFKPKQHPKICSVKIEKNNEIYFFNIQQDCINFLSQREFYSKDYIRKKLGNRIKEFCGWKISYKESD